VRAVIENGNIVTGIKKGGDYHGKGSSGISETAAG
jgi:hypothetical protein